MPKKKSGFDASYLSGLSQQAVETDIFGSDIEQKHKELHQEVESADQSHLPQISIDALQDNPWQGRRNMDKEELQKLADEIRENGFQGALAARPHPTEPSIYQIVWGHRRKRAAAMAGLTTLPVLIKEYSDEDMLFLGAKENLLREQLTPLDEAYMFHNMITSLGYTQEAVAAKVRQSRGYVRNRLVLVKVQPEVQEMVRQDPETVRAAYYLKDVEDPALRAELIQAVLERRITGETIPGYLLTLKENQAKQEQVALAAESGSAKVLTSSLTDERTTHQTNGNAIEAKLSTTSTPVTTKEAVSVPTDYIQGEAGQGATQLQSQPLQMSVGQVMEAGEKRGKELLEAGKLRTLLSQLQNYQSRCEKRQTPPSGEELTLLKAIEELSHALQEAASLQA